MTTEYVSESHNRAAAHGAGCKDSPMPTDLIHEAITEATEDIDATDSTEDIDATDSTDSADGADDDMPAEVCRAGLEMKFFVPESKSAPLLDSLRRLLSPDPHAGPDGEYDVMSLYLDTPGLDAYHRTVEHKWRIRRYGSSNTLFAELKAKPESGRVEKRRTEFSADQLPRVVDRDGPVKWFSKQISRNNLATTRLVSYRRNAFVGDVTGEPMRITLDSNIVATTSAMLHLPRTLHGAVSLGENRILEVKFPNEMPRLMAERLAELELESGSFSKYRQAIELL
jgi:VTC domain